MMASVVMVLMSCGDTASSFFSSSYFLRIFPNLRWLAVSVCFGKAGTVFCPVLQRDLNTLNI